MTWRSPEVVPHPSQRYRCDLCLREFDHDEDTLHHRGGIKVNKRIDTEFFPSHRNMWVQFLISSLWQDWPRPFLVCYKCMPKVRMGTLRKRRVKKLIKEKEVERAVNILRYGDVE